MTGLVGLGLGLGRSRGAQVALLLAADHAARVDGAAFIAPGFPVRRLRSLTWRLMASPRRFDRPPIVPWGWGTFNAQYWRASYRDFVEWWLARCFSGPHSTKQIKDGVASALVLLSRDRGNHAA